MVAQNIAAQGRCLMLSELVLFRTCCMIVTRHVINCGVRGGGQRAGETKKCVYTYTSPCCFLISHHCDAKFCRAWLAVWTLERS